MQSEGRLSLAVKIAAFQQFPIAFRLIDHIFLHIRAVKIPCGTLDGMVFL